MEFSYSIAGCSAAYIVALLHDGFKLGMHERRLRFTNYVEDPQGNAMDIDWTLGRQDGFVSSLDQCTLSGRQGLTVAYMHASNGDRHIHMM